MANNRVKVQIAKSIRDGTIVRQKIVRHIGTAHNDKELQRLNGLARTIINDRRDTSRGCETTLFTPKQYAELGKLSRTAGDHPVPDPVNLAGCREMARAQVGVREVFGEVYRSLGWNHVGGAGRRGGNRLIKEMVLARITHPLSKRKTVNRLYDPASVALNLDSVYRSMDSLDGATVSRICARSMQVARTFLPVAIKALFCDTTTLSFASEQEDGLRAKGFSKDGRRHRVPVMVALLLTGDGLPVGYEVFPGNRSEGSTLLLSVDGLRERYPAIDCTIVADAAMINKENEKALQERGIPYVRGARLRKLPVALSREFLSVAGYHSWGRADCSSSIARYRCLRMELGRNVRSSEEGRGKYRPLVVTHSPKRAKQDRHDRQNRLDKVARTLAKSKQPASLARGGNAQYLDVPKGRVQRSGETIRRMAAWDGLRGIVAWGCEAMDARDLVVQYRQLSTNEACFRINKHDRKIRPVFHWKERRVRSHLAICYMAFCCLQHLRYRLQVRGYGMSTERIRNAVNKMQISLLKDTENGGLYGMPSRIGSDARKICQTVGLEWNGVPFRVFPEEKGGGDVRYDGAA